MQMFRGGWSPPGGKAIMWIKDKGLEWIKRVLSDQSLDKYGP